jgi:hypothetical protein
MTLMSEFSGISFDFFADEFERQHHPNRATQEKSTRFRAKSLCKLNPAKLYRAVELRIPWLVSSRQSARAKGANTVLKS